MTPMLTLWLATLGAPAHACGPFFPHSLLASTDNTLLGGTYADFGLELQRLSTAPISPLNTRSTAEAEAIDARRELGPDHPQLTALARHRAALEQAKRGHISAPSPPPGLPWAWQRYLEGAQHWATDDRDAARTAFLEIAKLPPTQTGSRGLWAAHMLGRIDGGTAWFDDVHQRVTDGEPDTLGLVAEGLGWTALEHLHRGDTAGALRLYMAQHQAGDDSARASIERVVSQALRDPTEAQTLAQDNLTAGIVTAWTVSGSARPAQLQTWLSLATPDHVSIEQLAWTAWLARDIPRTQALLASAPDTALTQWLRARTAMLAGDISGALKLLEHTNFPTDKTWSCRWESRDWGEQPATVSPQAEVASERAALRMRQGDFPGALEDFARAGHWFDTAHVAERLVTVPELEAMVQGAVFQALSPDDQTHLKSVLARRLARSGDWASAAALFPPKLAAEARTLHALLTDGTAPALWQAALLMRHHGMQLVGTELGPDFAWSDGDYSMWNLRHGHDQDTLLTVTSAETERIAASAPSPDVRFHYRYVAAELAWQAAARTPSGSPEAPRVLCQAGRWLKDQDPEAADRFYKAMVWRGWGTDLGTLADRNRWFPSAEDCALDTVTEDQPPEQGWRERLRAWWSSGA